MNFLLLFVVLHSEIHKVVAVSGTAYYPSTQGYNGFQSTLTAQSNQTQSPVTAAASQTTDAVVGDCLLGDPDCSSSGITTTLAGPTAALHFSEECLLWNGTCSGNKTQALVDFFGGTDIDDTLTLLQENSCFVNSTYDCSGLEPGPVLSDFPVIRNWMRSPQCLSSSSEWASIFGVPQITASEGDSCCNTCYIAVQNVDVYYWPEPGSDSSCLSIIGNVTNPPLFGASTGTAGTYWGCTALDGHYTTTAILTSIGPVTFKESLINPWVSSPCGGASPAATTLPSQSIQGRDSPPRLHVRGHSLIIPSNASTDGLPPSTVVTGGYTL